MVLHAKGYPIKTAQSCSRMNELAREGKPNLILHDSDITFRNVLDFFEGIQTSSNNPVQFLMTIECHFQVLECLDAGVVEWCSIPVSFPELPAKASVFKKRLKLVLFHFRKIMEIKPNSVVEE